MLRRSRNPLRRRRGDRLGVEIAELAFALPVMTVLVFGTLELCEVLFLKQTLAVASYEAGRLAARPGTDSATIESRFNSIVANRRVTGATITLTPAEPSALQAGELIRIDVAAPVNPNSTTHLVLSGVPDITESVLFVRE